MKKYWIAAALYIIALAATTLIHLRTAHGMGHGRALPQPAASAIVTPEPSPSFTVNPEPSTIPAPAGLIQVGTITGATDAEVAMIRTGVELANQMLAKPCFKQWVLAAHYTENNGLTQQQIYDRITTVPSSVDVEMYYQNNRVVGFEYDPFDGVVHMNRKFVNIGSMAADNLMHEDRGHSLGFHHYGTFSTSVPYGMNYAYEGCSQPQEQRARGAKPYRPKGLRIEVRHKGKVAKKRKTR